MDTNNHWEELAKYFAGELDRNKKKQIERWITADPNRKHRVRKLYRIWKESEGSSYHLDVEKAWDKLVCNMDKLDQKPVSLHHKDFSSEVNEQYIKQYHISHKRVPILQRALITAVAAVVVMATGLFTYYNFGIEREGAENIGSRELVAQSGERVTYVLNDGSRIILHADSRIELPLNFNEKKRELFLEGEAYFEVAHDVTKPFVVHTEKAQTKVLGTKFLVQAWPDSSSKVEVVVSEGKVALGSKFAQSSNSSKEVTISRNQKGLLIPGSDPVVSHDIDMNWHMGWVLGELVFDDRPLKEILPKLERWYSIEIKLGDKSTGSNRLTAEIDYSQPMGEVLKGIALSLNLELEEAGRTFTYKTKLDER